MHDTKERIMDTIADRMLALDAKREAPDCTVTVQKAVRLDDRVQAVLFQAGGPITARNLEEAVSYAFADRARLLPGSAYQPNRDNPSLVMAFVAKNDPSKPYSETASFKGMKALVANVFSDENDNIWKKVGEGDSAMLVMESQDDLDAILAQRHSYTVATATVSATFGEEYHAGDALAWYDPVKEAIRYGMAVSSSLVFAFEEEPTFAAPKPLQVILAQDEGVHREVAFLPDEMRREAAAQDREPLSMDNMVQKHLAYMASLYSTRGEYFQKLKSLLQRHYGDRMQVA